MTLRGGLRNMLQRLSRWTATGKHFVLNSLLVVLSLAIGLAALEAEGRAFATIVAKQGKLFRPDAELGWTPLPNLDLVRKSSGEPWHITTDAKGIRGPSGWADADHTRLLVLGDSFAFGEGIDLADRFVTPAAPSRGCSRSTAACSSTQLRTDDEGRGAVPGRDTFPRQRNVPAMPGTQPGSSCRG